jgi:hypothetical protein
MIEHPQPRISMLKLSINKSLKVFRRIQYDWPSAIHACLIWMDAGFHFTEKKKWKPDKSGREMKCGQVEKSSTSK